MAIPVSPTAIKICFEALRKANRMDLLPRALDEWLEEIKSDIWFKGAKLKGLHITSVKVTTIGLSRYALPSDFYSDLNLTILEGDTTGIAQGGSASTITLAAAETISENDIIGKEILVTGNQSMSKCTAYDTGTKVATVSPDFQVAPSNGNGYTVVDTKVPLISKPIWMKDEQVPTKNKPEFFYHYGDQAAGEFELFPTADKVYGLQLRYYLNLSLVDLTSTRMTTIYRNWRNIWNKGVYYRAIVDPTLALSEKREYQAMIRELVAKETYENDIKGLQIRITDY